MRRGARQWDAMRTPNESKQRTKGESEIEKRPPLCISYFFFPSQMDAPSSSAVILVRAVPTYDRCPVRCLLFLSKGPSQKKYTYMGTHTPPPLLFLHRIHSKPGCPPSPLTRWCSRSWSCAPAYRRACSGRTGRWIAPPARPALRPAPAPRRSSCAVCPCREWYGVMGTGRISGHEHMGGTKRRHTPTQVFPLSIHRTRLTRISVVSSRSRRILVILSALAGSWYSLIASCTGAHATDSCCVTDGQFLPIPRTVHLGGQIDQACNAGRAS